MATGTVKGNFTTTRNNGDIFTAQEWADIDATLNNLYGFKGATQYMWLGPSLGNPETGTGAWSMAVTVGGPSAKLPYWQATTASTAKIVFSVPLFGTSSSVRAKVTAVDAHVSQAGSAGMTVTVLRCSGMSAASTPTTTSIGSTTGPASTGEKIITVGSISTGMDNDSIISIEVLPATNNDIIYGVRVTYDLSLFV